MSEKIERKLNIKLSESEASIFQKTIQKLQDDGFKVDEKMLLKFVIKDLDSSQLSKKVIKAITQAEALKMKASEEAKRIWM